MAQKSARDMLRSIPGFAEGGEVFSDEETKKKLDQIRKTISSDGYGALEGELKTLADTANVADQLDKDSRWDYFVANKKWPDFGESYLKLTPGQRAVVSTAPNLYAFPLTYAELQALDIRPEDIPKQAPGDFYTSSAFTTWKSSLPENQRNLVGAPSTLMDPAKSVFGLSYNADLSNQYLQELDKTYLYYLAEKGRQARDIPAPAPEPPPPPPPPPAPAPAPEPAPAPAPPPKLEPAPAPVNVPAPAPLPSPPPPAEVRPPEAPIAPVENPPPTMSPVDAAPNLTPGVGVDLSQGYYDRNGNFIPAPKIVPVEEPPPTPRPVSTKASSMMANLTPGVGVDLGFGYYDRLGNFIPAAKIMPSDIEVPAQRKADINISEISKPVVLDTPRATLSDIALADIPISDIPVADIPTVYNLQPMNPMGDLSLPQNRNLMPQGVDLSQGYTDRLGNFIAAPSLQPVGLGAVPVYEYRDGGEVDAFIRSTLAKKFADGGPAGSPSSGVRRLKMSGYANGGEVMDDAAMTEMFTGTLPTAQGPSPVDTAVSDFISSRSKLFTDPKQFLDKTYENIKQEYGDINRDPKAMEAFLMDNIGFGGLTAYHGGSKLFKQFDPSKRGTGEGFQQYGVGSGYAAQARPVAEGYRRYLGGDSGIRIGNKKLETFQKTLRKELDQAQTARDQMMVHDKADLLTMVTSSKPSLFGRKSEEMSPQEILKEIKSGGTRQYDPRAVEWLESTVIPNLKYPGYLYKGDIPDEIIPTFLDWDKPLSQQTKEVRSVLEKDPIFQEVQDPRKWSEYSGGFIQMNLFKDSQPGKNISGEDLYKFLSLKLESDQAATDYLDKLGLRGIRYLDEYSRGKEKGTSNFVVFRPEDYKVEEINDLPLEEWIKQGKIPGKANGGEISNDEFIQQMMTGTPPEDMETEPGLLPPELREAIDVPLDFANLLIRGTAGAVGGPAYGLYKGVTSDKFGTKEGVAEARSEAERMMGEITGEPKTQAAKDIMQFVGEKLEAAKIPPMPQFLTTPVPGPGSASALMRSYELAETPPEGVIKLPGGNYLAGQVEKFVKPLKQQIPWTESQLAEMPDVAKAEAPNLALNKFIETKLTKYIKNDMATERDPLRLQADKWATEQQPKLLAEKDAQIAKAKADMERAQQERGVEPEMLTRSRARLLELEKERDFIAARTGLHYAPQPTPELYRGGVNFARQNRGFPSTAVAKSEAGKLWEDLSDRFFMNRSPVEEVTSPNYFLRDTDTQRIMAENPWLYNVPPETQVQMLNRGINNEQDTGFKHMTDELRNALNPDSGLPPSLQISPKDLEKMTVPQAADLVDRINAHRAVQKAEANALAAQKSIEVYKEYPETEEGLRWVEMKLLPYPEVLPEGFEIVNKAPKAIQVRKIGEEGIISGRDLKDAIEGIYMYYPDTPGNPRKALQEALRYEGDVMQHCVGGYCPDVISGQSRVLSLRDSTGRPHATIEVIPPQVNFGDVIGGNPAFPDRNEELYRMMDTMTTFEIQQTPLYKEKAAAIAAQKPPGIRQIKGENNRKPSDSYQPFITDFIASRQWSFVQDLQNTNLVPIKPTLLKNAEELGFNPQVVLRQNDQTYITKEEFNRLADLFGGINKYAAGGEVTDFIKRAA